MVPARCILPALLVVCVISLVAFGAGPQTPAQSEKALRKERTQPPEVIETDIVTREAVCRWAVQPPVLDGKLDDKCWEQAAPIEQFASFWNKTPRAGTRAYLVWDDQALYYGATMTDTELRSFGTKRNDHLWKGDVFELFFKPNANRPEYYEFQANPRAVVFECAFPKRGDYPRDFSQAPVLGNQAVVTLSGTLDEPGDRDEGWTVEGRIPWTAFRFHGKPKPGDEWRFALCRYDYGPKGTKEITMSSAPLTQPSFHRHEDYGKLRFEGPRR
jgi:hypothetical protein